MEWKVLILCQSYGHDFGYKTVQKNFKPKNSICQELMCLMQYVSKVIEGGKKKTTKKTQICHVMCVDMVMK